MSFSEKYVTSLKEHKDYENAVQLKTKADSDAEYALFCIEEPAHKVFFYDTDKALMPGHIYSQAGEKEYTMSGFCEYCFDAAFTEDGEEP